MSLLLFILVVSLLFPACGPLHSTEHISSGREVSAEIKEQLINLFSQSPLEYVQYLEDNPKLIQKIMLNQGDILGPGAFFYSALVINEARQSGLLKKSDGETEALVETLLRLAGEHEEGIYKTAARNRIVEDYIKQQNYKQLEEVCAYYVNDGDIAFFTTWIEALYYVQEYEKLHEVWSEYYPAYKQSLQKNGDNEVHNLEKRRAALFKALGTLKLLDQLPSSASGPSLVDSIYTSLRLFFIYAPSSELHHEAWIILQQAGGFDFFKAEQTLDETWPYYEALFIIKALKGQGIHKEALQEGLYLLQKIEKIISENMTQAANSAKKALINDLLNPQLIRELLTTGLRLGANRDVYAMLNSLLDLPLKYGFTEKDVYKADVFFTLLESAGHGARRLARHKEAFNHYKPASTLGFQNERMRWYAFDSLVRLGLTSSDAKKRQALNEAVEYLPKIISKWQDPGYYDDTLSVLSMLLVRNRNWQLLETLYQHIHDTGSRYTRAKFSYITARAGEEGYLDLTQSEIEGRYKKAFNDSCGLGYGLYYRIMAAYKNDFSVDEGLSSSKQINEENILWPFCSPVENESNDYLEHMEDAPSVGADGSFEKGLAAKIEFITGFLPYELVSQAYTYTNKMGIILPRKEAAQLSEAMTQKGDYQTAVRIMNRALVGKSPNKEEVYHLYPHPYADKIDALQTEHDSPAYLFSALVREESLFMSKIESHAGAIGLSQLMPSTAADIAGRMRLADPDLLDPETNLAIGSWYLNHLIGLTSNVSYALFAYNAGQGRLRSWVKEYGDLPDDLFLESVPFRETSYYGRKILVSSVIYAKYYYNTDYQKVVELIFSNIGTPATSY